MWPRLLLGGTDLGTRLASCANAHIEHTILISVIIGLLWLQQHGYYYSLAVITNMHKVLMLHTYRINRYVRGKVVVLLQNYT